MLKKKETPSRMDPYICSGDALGTAVGDADQVDIVMFFIIPYYRMRFKCKQGFHSGFDDCYQSSIMLKNTLLALFLSLFFGVLA